MFRGSNPGVATVSGGNFLDVNPGCGPSILNITEDSDAYDLTNPFELNPEEGKPVYPKPGFCIKSKTDEDVKVFINVCHCEDVPKPDEKLVSPKDAEDEAIRFPLGLGLPRTEKDKSGKDCVCFDVVINSEFLNTLLKDDDARSVVLSLCIQGIADKYGIIVRDDCCIKLTKPYHGTVQRQFVKTTKPYGIYSLEPRQGNAESSAPLIRLMESATVEDETPSDNSIQSVRPKNSKLKNNCPVRSNEKQNQSSPVPKNQQPSLSEPSISMLPKKEKTNVQYGLFQIPASNSYTAQYVFEAYLPYCIADGHAQLKVFVSNNRVVVTEKMCNFNVDINLPNPVIPERCRANFYNGDLVVVLACMNHNEAH